MFKHFRIYLVCILNLEPENKPSVELYPNNTSLGNADKQATKTGNKYFYSYIKYIKTPVRGFIVFNLAYIKTFLRGFFVS